MQEQIILERLKGYTEAFYKKDFDALIDYLYQDEVHTFRKSLEWAAKALEPFGETKGFLQLFPNINTAAELEQLSDKAFISIYFSNAIRKLPDDKTEELAKSILVDDVDHAEYIANVTYSFINVFSQERERVQSEAQLIQSEGEWYVLFKPGMEAAFDVYREQLDEYNAAKAKDKPEVAKRTEDDIEKFAIYGYKNYNDEVFISPRFKDANDFSEGLAAVKVFSKWGYINKMGDFEIKPAFDKAEDFENGFAQVGIRGIDFFTIKKGLIDKTGQWIIPAEYDNFGAFGEGYFGISKDDYWAFANTKGEIITPFKYEAITAFENGKAQAHYVHDGDDWYFYIDQNGNEIGEVPAEELRFDVEEDWDDEDW